MVIEPFIYTFYYSFDWLIIMSFGKRAVRVKKDVSEDSGNAKKSINKSDSVSSNNNSISSNDNISNISVKQKKTKPKKTYGFMKKTSSKSSGLLFGQTKEEKLELFIKNTKIIHPNMPNFWLQKEINKFKKKFNIENDK
jgi:hypothetical protein